MLFILLEHQWKAFWRSRNAGRNVIMHVFMAIIVLYLLAVAAFVGLYLHTLLGQAFPEQDSIVLFLGVILYFFLADLLMRFMFQDLPTLVLQPYLIQNIKRSQLLLFLNIRSLFSFFTLLPLLLFAPFSLTVIGKAYGTITGLAFLLSIIGLTLFNHFLILYIKRKTILHTGWLIGFFAGFLLLVAADYFDIFSLRNISTVVFSTISKRPALCFLFLVLAASSFYTNYRFLHSNLYVEEGSSSQYRSSATEFSWLQRLGVTGDLIAIDLKLILRNKRPRSLLMMSSIFLLYGFMFYKTEYLADNDLGLLLFGAIFVTGMFMMNYGQFLFAWQASHFDGLMATSIPLKTYIKSKFLLLIGFCTAALFVSLPYGFISWKIIPIQLAAYFFNIGIHIVVTAYIGTYNYKGLDLSKGASFNYQGIGTAQWLYTLVILFIGLLLYAPFSFFVGSWAGIAAVGIIGIGSLLLQNWWIHKLAAQLQLRKHKILAGFREK